MEDKLQAVRKSLEKVNESSTPSWKQVSSEELRKLADEARATFTNEDIQRLRGLSSPA